MAVAALAFSSQQDDSAAFSIILDLPPQCFCWDFAGRHLGVLWNLIYQPDHGLFLLPLS